LLISVSCISGQDFHSALILAPYAISFGEVSVGKHSSVQTITLLNAGPASIQMDKIEITGSFGETTNCPVPPAQLAQNQTCGIEVTFRPTAPGSVSGTVSIFHDRSSEPLTVSLEGVGTLATSSVQISTSALDFGEQAIGIQSEPQTITLSNNSQKTLLISDIEVGGDFTIMPRSSCESLNGSLAPNASCTVVITFTPLGAGIRAGQVTFMDDAESSPQRVPLRGMGKQQ
jgi:centrosomal CEP192-like protein